MKIGLLFAVMGFGFIGCAGIDLPGTESGQAVEPVSTTPVVTTREIAALEDKTTVAEPTAETPAEKNATPLTKEQCSEKYPVVVGQLSLRQTCVNDSAKGSMGQFTAKQRAIISGCADKLLSLAARADKGKVAFDVYKTEKQKLRETCNTSIRMAGGTTATAAKTTKANATKATIAKSTTKKATTAVASTKKAVP
ncbi:MAG: hypothetical protein RLZZ09_2082 [Pseudomonadota bacterium]|jgi:hypothetical protein